jgi:hypothetical protein
VTIEEAAEALTVSPSTILSIINDEVLPAQHLCKGAPWISRSDDLKREDVRAEAKARLSRRPSSGIHAKETLISREIVSMHRVKPPS